MNLTLLPAETEDARAAWCERITESWRESVLAIVETGRLLIAAKDALDHGEWLVMFEGKELPFGARMAQMLMKIAASPRLANPQCIALLPPAVGTIYDVVVLPDDEFEARLADGTICPEMIRDDLKPETEPLIAGPMSDAEAGAGDTERGPAAADTRMVKDREPDDPGRTAETRRQLARDLFDSIPLGSTGRKFPIVYADPPWRRKAGIGDRAYENHYPTMSWDEIIALPVARRVQGDAWLFLWIPRPHLLALHPVEIDTALGRVTVEMPLAWAVAQAWGFDAYSTCFVWTKTDDECPDDHGMGLITWDQDEILCLFKRGRGLPKPDTDMKYGSNHRARPLAHSAKPDFYRQMINDMTGGLPVLELFAREDDDHVLPANYFTWGNQSKNTAEMDWSEPAMPDPAIALADAQARQRGENLDGSVRRETQEAAPHAPVAETAELAAAEDDFEIPAFLRRNDRNEVPA